jgi:hypothetical protein
MGLANTILGHPRYLTNFRPGHPILVAKSRSSQIVFEKLGKSVRLGKLKKIKGG